MEKALYDGFDEERQGVLVWSSRPILVTCKDQVVDELGPLVEAGGGLIFDWHTTSFRSDGLPVTLSSYCNAITRNHAIIRPSRSSVVQCPH